MNQTNDQVRTPSDYSRRGVGPGAWHASQALKALLWADAVIGLGMAEKCEAQARAALAAARQEVRSGR